MKAGRYIVMGWRQSQGRVIWLGSDLRRPIAEAKAWEMFETGAYYDVEVRRLLPGNLTKLARHYTKDPHG